MTKEELRRNLDSRTSDILERNGFYEHSDSFCVFYEDENEEIDLLLDSKKCFIVRKDSDMIVLQFNVNGAKYGKETTNQRFQ